MSHYLSHELLRNFLQVYFMIKFERKLFIMYIWCFRIDSKYYIRKLLKFPHIIHKCVVWVIKCSEDTIVFLTIIRNTPFDVCEKGSHTHTYSTKSKGNRTYTLNHPIYTACSLCDVSLTHFLCEFDLQPRTRTTT